jgi:hypothetical protein
MGDKDMNSGKARRLARCLPLAGAAAIALVLSGPVLADEADATPPSSVTEPVQSGNTYPITDEADSPPVNYRSEQDERYNTPGQHDAEMFAEEYERQRDEKLAKDRALLDNMNTVSSPNSGMLNGDLGAADAGFAPKAPY